MNPRTPITPRTHDPGPFQTELPMTAAPPFVPPTTELVTKSPARCQTPASAQRQSCRMGAPVPRGKRTVRRRLRLPVRGVADSRTVFPSVVPWTQQPRQAARRADGTPRVERVDQNRQAPTALLRRPAYLGSNHESPSAHTTQTSWGGWHDRSPWHARVRPHADHGRSED